MPSKIRLKINHRPVTRKDKLKALKQSERQRVQPPKKKRK